METEKCPYCGYPPVMETYRIRPGITLSEIYCPMYYCELKTMVKAKSPSRAIELWNQMVEDEKAKMKPTTLFDVPKYKPSNESE